jgi:tetratricopeptide (TPR) repeat protein
MLLRRSGVAIVTQNGTPFDFRGEKDCCFTEVGEPEPMWPLGSHERNVWLKNQGAINFLGNRLGPWRAIPGDQPSILSLGGGYLEVNGKADLTQWNKKFWNYNDQLASDSASLGQYVEVGVYDGWAAKGHCFAGGNAPYHPFLPENNVQSEDHCNFLFDAVQETWIRKVVQVMGRHGNVTWETCNECSLAGGWNTAWEEKVIATIKDEETKRGYPQHIVATNAQTTVLSADWDEFHNEGSPQHGTDKITGVNEYNPEPPMLGAKVVDNYCAARDSGTYFWLWRHDMPLKEFEIAAATSPNNAEIYTYVGGIYRRQGRWREAVARFERALSLDPRNARIAFRSAINHLFMRDWPAAAASYKRALEIAPDDLDSKISLAYLEVFQNNSLAAGKKILQSIPAGIDPNGMVAEARWDFAMLERDYAGAEKILADFSLKDSPQDGADPKTFYEGRTALARGDIESAQRYLAAAAPSLEKRMRNDADDPLRHAELGLLYAYMQRKEDALREGRRAVEMEPESQNAFHGAACAGNLALVYALVGEQDQAITLIERLLSTPGPIQWLDHPQNITLAELRLRWEWDALRSNPRFQKILAGPEPKVIYQ